MSTSSPKQPGGKPHRYAILGTFQRNIHDLSDLFYRMGLSSHMPYTDPNPGNGEFAHS